MAIQYYMRGYNISAPGTVGYVDWVVNDTPDSLATYVPSPYISANITNITVNKTVTSKVDNFLKPFESLTAIGGTGSDGYFFHLNSYDWLHATPPGPPISVPSYLTGLSVVRGSSNGITPRDYSTLFWAENALKWLFAFNTNGDGYTIGSALPVGMGNLSVDGYLEVGTTPALSGIIRIPNNQFIVSRNSTNTVDGYLIGQDNVNRVRIGSPPGNQVYIPGNLRVDGYVRDGGNSSLSGFIRNSNATSIITFRDSLNTNDISALASTAGNLIVLGDVLNFGTRFNMADGYEHIFQANSTNLLRIGNIGSITYVNFENTALSPTISQFNTSVGNGKNLTFKAQDTSGVGGFGGSTIISSGQGPSADGYLDLRINNSPKIRIFGSTVPTTADFPNNSSSNPNSIQVFNPSVRFYSSVVAPNIIQDQTNLGVNAEPMLIKSQRANAATRTGGDLRLSSGGGNAVLENAPAASHSLDGYVRLQTGTVDRLFIDATANRVTQTLNIFAFNGLDGTFDAAAVTTPVIRQRNDITNSITGQLMTIQSQNATGTNTIGGSLNITSGQGTFADGYIRLQTGSIDRLFLDGYNSQAILTLSKFFFSETISAPTIKQIDAISVPSGFGQTLTIQAQNAPGTNTRGGNLTFQTGTGTEIIPPGSFFRDGYTRHGRIFFEVGSATSNIGEFGVDGYGSYFSAGGNTSNPVTVDGYFRVPNATWALSAARNPATAPNASIHLIGTSTVVDGYNKILLGDVNTGFIFNTSVDGYYDFRVNSVPSAFIDGYKFSFKAGRRRHITPVSNTYLVLVTDDFLAINASSVYTVTLPASPTLGDTYEFKDINGTAATNNITISGNGNNIDGISTLVINTNFAAIVVTYTGARWSVS